MRLSSSVRIAVLALALVGCGGRTYVLAAGGAAPLVYRQENEPPPPASAILTAKEQLVILCIVMHEQGDKRFKRVSPLGQLLPNDETYVVVETDGQFVVWWPRGWLASSTAVAGFEVPPSYGRLLGSLIDHDGRQPSARAVAHPLGGELAAAAKGDDLVIAAFAVKFLGYLRQHGVAQLPLLVESTRHPDFNVRLAATAALGWLAVDRSEVRLALQALKDDPDEHVRANAETALKRIATR